jgi:hypothetical protein
MLTKTEVAHFSTPETHRIRTEPTEIQPESEDIPNPPETSHGVC